MPNKNKKHSARASKYAQLVEAQSPEPQGLEPEAGDGGATFDAPRTKSAAKSIQTQAYEDRGISVSATSEEESETRLSSSKLYDNQSSVTSSLREDSKDECSVLLAPSASQSSDVNLYTDASELGDRSTSKSQAARFEDGTAISNNKTDKYDRKVSQSSSQISTSFISTSAAFTNSRRSSSLAGSRVAINYNANGPDDSGIITYSNLDAPPTNLKRTISSSMMQLDKSLRMDKFEVSWTNLSFSYSPKWYHKRPQTHVLHDISGRIKSNQLVAIIGPSGCGKTTLLQFLAGNNPSNRDKLRIVGLDEPKVAFIGQDDGLLPGITARETLLYASKLQNNDPKFNHEDHIKPILSELGLTECADRSVTKLSGGQVKRVTIAQELLYPTNLLILDEVTSGLDASTSYSIIKLLKHLVSDSNYPMSIVISIHQPSAKLFSVFDQVYVMAKGSCLYSGSCQVDEINAYLLHFNLECPKFNNMADYLIEVATNNDLSSDETVREQMIQFQRKLSQASLEQDVKQRHELVEKQACEVKGEKDFSITIETPKLAPTFLNSSLYDAICKSRSLRARPFFRQFFIHLDRSFLRIRRSYILTYLQLVTYVILGLQLATFYGDSIGVLSGCPRLPSSLFNLVLSNGSEAQDLTAEMRRIQENMNFLLVTVMTATFAALEITVITFPLEAKTVKREWRNGWYRVSSYFMGRTFADLPFQIAFVVVFSLIIYSLTGQIGLTSWRFGSFVIIMVMIALVAQSVGFTFGALFMDNLPAAVFTAPLCIFPSLLFSGFFSRASQIPKVYQPMTYISHFRYAFDALLVTLYGHDRCDCNQDTLTSYHASLENQTSSVRDMFKYLFGSSDCGPLNNSDENSIEETVAASSSLTASTMAMNNGTTPIPMTTVKFRSLEDALVDSVFDHMNKTSTTPLGEQSVGAMDHLADKFSTRITTMLNRQSNYGHDVPEHCSDFNSYLITEFELKDEDLLIGMLALVIAVVLTRLICNIILNFTIASRIR